jgi:glycosyltransferase involved in cell wall biosynthesis
MDDGSSDSTNQICKNYEKENPSIRIYKNLKNIGLTKSLNILISHAQDYKIFSDLLKAGFKIKEKK